MWIYVWDSEIKGIYLWDTPVKEVYLWDTKIRPTWPSEDYLCFTANTAGSTVQLTKKWNPTSVTLEISTDWFNWSTYTIWDTITLANARDKVYRRNASETPTWFCTSSSNRYQFVMSWEILASWDINYLLCKNSTTTLSWSYTFYFLFWYCSSLLTAPKLPATTLVSSCYLNMFYNCSNLTTLPSLPSLTLTYQCYRYMFYGCSKIKLSTTQTWEYQTPYRIPIQWTWTVWSSSLDYMFTSTWWTFTWSPTINTTYYTSNTVV